ncbi:hypothetical protein OC846_000900 [Tilletia horrida]|uniref:Zn(2)-C6 fungal-type domain-containing protein n=1 Tax=Tilletia horrida TaxID=155126 RepID=A0AAN6GV75_9BASI|nr:hypothetical protein OC845_006226 [Tilletia horrida]KAK0556873.1 hypothetical protein OC846_000900 [Tilletia horrida]KAK0563322.1 hypothetical protein OC861_004869 [Tilletia horrida]
MEEQYPLPPGGGARDQLQQLQHSHFHHPFPSTHHPYTQIQQQERLQQQHQQHQDDPSLYHHHQQQHQHHVQQHNGQEQQHRQHHPHIYAQQQSQQQPQQHHYGGFDPHAHASHLIALSHPQSQQQHPQPPPNPPASANSHPDLGFYPITENGHEPFQQNVGPHLGSHHSGFPPAAQPSLFPTAAQQTSQFPQSQHPSLSMPPQGQMGSTDPAIQSAASASPMINLAPHTNAGAPGMSGIIPAFTSDYPVLPPNASAIAADAPPKASPNEKNKRVTGSRAEGGRKSKGAEATGPPSGKSSALSGSGTTLPPPHSTPSGESKSSHSAPLHMHNATVPTRKQNQSCDNCRRRKIACRPPPPHVANPHQRCAHCLNKGVDCTKNYVNRHISIKEADKSVTKKTPPSRKPSTGQAHQHQVSGAGHRHPGLSSDEGDSLDDDEDTSSIHASATKRKRVHTESSNGLSSPQIIVKKLKAPRVLSISTELSEAQQARLNGGRPPRLHPTAQLIRYLLCPSESTPFNTVQPRFAPYPSPITSSLDAASAYFPTPLRLPIPTASARRLAVDSKLRSEVLHDFVESFLMIVNPRFALLDARRVRAGIYPFEDLYIEDDESTIRHSQSTLSKEAALRKSRRRSKESRKWRNTKEYLCRSDTEDEQDDGGLPSCAPAPGQHRDQHLATPSVPINGSTSRSTAESSSARGKSASVPLSALRPRPLPDVLIAVIIAFGAKFSSHEILTADRADSVAYMRRAWSLCKKHADAKAASRLRKQHGVPAGDTSSEDDDEDEYEGSISSAYATEPSILGSGRSTIAKSLVIKAQDVMEKRRAYAVPTLTNVQASLLVEPLYDQGVRLHDEKSGTPKWEVLAELLQQYDAEEAWREDEPDTDTASISSFSRLRTATSEGPSRPLDDATIRHLMRKASQISARTRRSDTSGLYPSLDFSGFWHGVALRHLLDLRLHEADYVSTLCDIDILTARRPDFFGETEVERKLLVEELQASVEVERNRTDSEADGRMPSHKLNALEAAIGATNSLSTFAQSCWWMASTSDAMISAFFRRRPLMRPEEMASSQIPNLSEDESDQEQEEAADAAETDLHHYAKHENISEDRALVLQSLRGSAAADSTATNRKRTESAAMSTSRPSSRRSAANSNPSSLTTSASRKRARMLESGGITREAGPDPFEASDESDVGDDSKEDATRIEKVNGDGAAAAATTPLKANASVSVSGDATMSESANTSTANDARRAKAKQEKLALLGERASLPEKDSYAIWYSGISELCKIHRSMWDYLWSPRARAQGVRLPQLYDLQRRTEKWRRMFLPKIGVPYDPSMDASSQGGATTWPADWDFIAASTANTLSINSFALEILIWQAIEDHGIAEAREVEEEGSTEAQDAAGTDSTKATAADRGGDPDKPDGKEGEKLSPAAEAERLVCNNALAASLRIAALVDVLRANQYLRLDPNVLHFTIHLAGQFLVTYDNPVVYGIIEGLKQYGRSYEEGLEQADQLAKYAAVAEIPREVSMPNRSPGSATVVSAGEVQPPPIKTIDKVTALGEAADVNGDTEKDDRVKSDGDGDEDEEMNDNEDEDQVDKAVEPPKQVSLSEGQTRLNSIGTASTLTFDGLASKHVEAAGGKDATLRAGPSADRTAGAASA